MAKRDKSTQPGDAQPAEPIERRARNRRAAPRATASELPEIPEPGDAADRAARELEIEEAMREATLVTEPSEDDIRLRAYHRYLERGGGHGAHFDDWIEAERELKKK